MTTIKEFLFKTFPEIPEFMIEWTMWFILALWTFQIMGFLLNKK